MARTPRTASNCEFTARFAYSGEIDGALVVGVADSEMNTKRYLLFQLGLDPDEQDISLGLDGIHVERDDQRWSGHGAFEKCTLEPRALRLDLNATGIEHLECSAIEVRLDLDTARSRR